MTARPSPATWLLIVLATLTLAATSWAQETVSLRWVKASDTQLRGAGDPRLKDVEPTLKKRLPYSSYQLIQQEKVELQGVQRVHLDKGFVVHFSGTQENLRIIVERNNKEFLNTTVTLKEDKPLIVGGFPADEDTGKFMLVLKAR